MGYTLFKVTMGIFSLIPLIIGTKGMIKGFKDFPESENFTAKQKLHIDSEWRFHSALFLALGFIMIYMIPNIENPQYGFYFEIFMSIILFSGIGRIISIFRFKKIEPHFIPPLIAEFIMAPLFIAWRIYLS